MQNLTRRAAAEPESMDQLRGDCALMAPHWSSPFSFTTTPTAPPASHEALRGVRVPAASARLLEGMSEYGDW
ncbi:hypothetical protein [Streptomyces albidus (ex Kaewkla and Franco 2022)]|uniref:hypothetical protein n=1 Tax=Streptomyces albidus (ex Kaewkla and Franco 2022) TaxID=722709 RepID=UPI0015EF7083|nr:hypothetical protein [Streptomyces albidus (ex Kaewkla and Franco 2022)]